MDRTDSRLRDLNTVPEAADFLRCARTKVHKLIKEGTLPSVKIGGSRLVTREALERLVAESGEGAR